MVDIVVSNFYLKAGEFDRDIFESCSLDLFEKWDEDVKSTITFDDYSLYLVVEEGSVKGVGKVVVGSLAALYMGIANYGSFITGVETISHQVDFVTERLFSSAKESFNLEAELGNTRKATGSIQYLRKQFDLVQMREITPDQAIENVKRYFGDDVHSVPSFIDDVSESFYEIDKFPEQLSLMTNTSLCQLATCAKQLRTEVSEALKRQCLSQTRKTITG